MTVVCALAVAWLSLAAGVAGGDKLPPVDEARRDPVVQAFRDRVLAAARREDVTALLALTAERVTFEEDELTHAEIAARIAQWPAAARARFWQDLRDALALGLAYHPDSDEPLLVAPYVAVLLAARAEVDPEVMAITGSRVAVHERASSSSPIVARLDYDVVVRGPDGPRPTGTGEFGGTYEWVQIRMEDSRVGWVVSKYVRSVGEPRFAFGKVGGAWKLIGYWTAD